MAYGLSIRNRIEIFAESMGIDGSSSPSLPFPLFLHEAVLVEAKMLLKTTDLTVQEISDRLNFSSPSAFVQFFKKHTGTTPKKI